MQPTPSVATLPLAVIPACWQEKQTASNTETTYEHVVLDDCGVPVIEGTTMKVIELVLDTVTCGWSSEEAQRQHPYLSLGQIYSALAYYWDYQDVLDG